MRIAEVGRDGAGGRTPGARAAAAVGAKANLTLRERNMALAAVLGMAVVARVAVALYLGDVVDAPPLLTDQRSYHLLGASLVAGRGFSFDVPWYPFTPAHTPTAHWSFLFSLWVGAIYGVFGVHPLAARLAGAVAGGLLLPWMVYRLANRLKLPAAPWAGRGTIFERVTADLGLLAALLAAVYFYFVLYSATLMTETFFIVAVLWSLERGLALAERLGRGRREPAAAAVRPEREPLPGASDAAPAPAFPGVLALGVSLGTATLLRQSILPWAGVLGIWLLWLGWRAGRLRQACAALVVAMVVVVAMVLPFTLRNLRVYGQFLLLNSNAGFAMYSAQHPMHGTHFQEFTAAPLPEDLPLGNEAALDRELMRRGIGFVLAEPGRYLLLSLSRARAYFEFWPKAETSLLNNIGRVGSFGLFLPFMLYGLWLALSRWQRARRPGTAAGTWGLAVAFMVVYSLMHIATWAMPRYRLPVDAVALPFAALALQDLAGRVAGRRVAGKASA